MPGYSWLFCSFTHSTCVDMQVRAGRRLNAVIWTACEAFACGCSEEEEADEDAGAGGMYRDFFTDERQDVDDADEDQLEDEQDRHGVNAKGKKRRRPRQTAAAVAAAQGGDQDGGRGEDDWDGEQLFDTGEGRDGGSVLRQHVAGP